MKGIGKWILKMAKGVVQEFVKTELLPFLKKQLDQVSNKAWEQTTAAVDKWLAKW